MLLNGYRNTPLGRIWVPDEFDASQIGRLPGFVCQRSGRELVLDTLDGWVHIYEEQTPAQNLGGLFSKFKKVFKRVVSVPKKLFKKANDIRLKTTKSVLKSKYGRMVVRGAGIVFAPFTGGLSLAAAEAAARYGKSRYVLNQSRSGSFRRAAVGAVVGYAGGAAISSAYGAVAKGGFSSLNPFAGKIAGTAAKASGTSGGLWSTVGKTALTAGKAVATSYISAMAKGQKPGADDVMYGVADQILPPGYAESLYNSYDGAGLAPASYGAGGGAVTTAVPDGDYIPDENGEPGFLDSADFKKYAPFAIVAAGAAVGLTMMNGNKRKRGK